MFTKDQHSFTLMIFTPSARSEFRKIQIPRSYVYAVLTLAAVGLLTVAFGAVSFARHATLVVKYNLAQMENRKLREENHVVQHSADKLQGQIATMQDVQRKLAEATGVSPSADTREQVGSGGPDAKDPQSIALAASSLDAELRQIKEIIDSRQIKLSAIPSSWPVRGYVSDGFGGRSNPFTGGGYETHAGIDIATNFGTAIEATGDGIVIFAGSYGGYGNLVVIDHGYGITTRYGHMSRIDVTVGQHVHRGMQIGAVGSTGRSTGPHCHYEVRLHDRPVNPMNYLPVL
jgi:murein DD-endopeptidase MepM/ murein hydrolase activator NlpD